MNRFLGMILAAGLCLALAAPVAAATDQPRPFAGFGSSSVDTYLDPGASSDWYDACPAGATWRFYSTTWAQFTHLGRTYMQISHCTWVDLAAGTGSFAYGKARLWAANKDLLVLGTWGTFHVGMTPDGLVSYVDMHWTVIGGTGRFANATGSGDGSAMSLIATNSTSGTWRGTISY